MIAESVSSLKTEGEVPLPPYILSAEQVSVLSQYGTLLYIIAYLLFLGHIQVRRLKKDEDLHDPKAFLPSCSHTQHAFEVYNFLKFYNLFFSLIYKKPAKLQLVERRKS